MTSKPKSKIIAGCVCAVLAGIALFGGTLHFFPRFLTMPVSDLFPAAPCEPIDPHKSDDVARAIRIALRDAKNRWDVPVHIKDSFTQLDLTKRLKKYKIVYPVKSNFDAYAWDRIAFTFRAIDNNYSSERYVEAQMSFYYDHKISCASCVKVFRSQHKITDCGLEPIVFYETPLSEHLNIGLASAKEYTDQLPSDVYEDFFHSKQN